MQTIAGYVFTERLGKGTYGEVFKAVNQKSRIVVAVKRMSKRSLCKRAQDNLVDEIGILKNLRHRNIARMVDFTWDSDHVYIFMEYLGGGDLSSFLKTRRRLPESAIRYFLQQLAFALHYLSERSIVHMDIKPQNILLTSTHNPTLKLTDFGFAQSLEEPVKMNEIRGSLLYMAPEIFKFGVYEKSCDLWSVGVILFECLFGRAPFASGTVEELKAKLAADFPVEMPSQPVFSPDCIDLVSKLLKRDPSRRIHHDHFFVHPFIDLAHAPCPESLHKAVDLLMIAEDLSESGDLVDAYLNYKEGLTHLIAALQFEDDPSRKKIIRSKLSSYIKVAEDLSKQLQNGSASVPAQTDRPAKRPPSPVAPMYGGCVRGKSATMPATREAPRRPPLLPNIHPGSSSTLTPSASSIAPTNSIPTTTSHEGIASPSATVEEGVDAVMRRSSPTSQFRSVGRIAAWFGSLGGRDVSTGSAPSTAPTPEGTAVTPAPAAGSAGTDSTTTAPQPVVKTAHEYALSRLEVLAEELQSKNNAFLPKVIAGLRKFYILLNNNEFKSAMDFIQAKFSIWLTLVKKEKDPYLQKAFRSELNDALTAAERIKTKLKAKEDIATLLDEDETSSQSCLIS